MTNDALRRTQHYALPMGLDPRATTDEVLRRHGWSRRSDTSGRLHLADVLDRHFALPVEAFVPEFVTDDEWGRTRSRRRGPAGDVFAPADWASVIRERNASPGEDFNDFASWVSATWVVPVVPNVTEAHPGGGKIGFWVGIDGEDHDQVLQAGIAAKVTRPPFPGEIEVPLFPEVEYWAWHEWFTSDLQEPSVRVGNFPVSAGDTVAVVVWAPQRDCSIFLMANVTRGHAFNTQVSSPGGIKIGGGSVEWAVEQVTGELPRFDPVTFNDCIGGSAVETFDLLPEAQVTEIRGHDNVRMTTTTILSPNSMVVHWNDFD